MKKRKTELFEGNYDFAEFLSEIAPDEELEQAGAEKVKLEDLSEIETLSPYEVADIMKISSGSAYKVFAQEGFPSFRVGNQYRVRKKDFVAWIDKKKAEDVREKKHKKRKEKLKKSEINIFDVD